MGKLRLGAFISGGGTNLQAILDASAEPDYPAEVSVVVSNRPDAHGLVRAAKAGIPTVVVPHQSFTSRESHEVEIIRKIEAYRIELVMLAGYMRIVNPLIIDRFYNRIKSLPGVINIHPADTRAYQGTHGYEYALGLLPDHPQRLKETCITVHFVDAGVDTGPVILQAPVPIMPNDTLEDLRERGLKMEHQIYPQAIRLYAQDRLKLENNLVVIQPV